MTPMSYSRNVNDKMGMNYIIKYESDDGYIRAVIFQPMAYTNKPAKVLSVTKSGGS